MKLDELVANDAEAKRELHYLRERAEGYLKIRAWAQHLKDGSVYFCMNTDLPEWVAPNDRFDAIVAMMDHEPPADRGDGFRP